MRHISIIILFLTILMACSPSRPSGILSEGKMTDVLYDMHKVQAMYDANEGGIDGDDKLIAARASVLKKYNLTQAEWDSSYNYYTRNADQLYDIYVQLNERLDNDVVALGGKVAGVQGEEADTANVWPAEPSFLLMQQPPFNLYTFEVSPDSTFQDGDRITLQFDTQFMFQAGTRDLAAYIAVYYDNDSVATLQTRNRSDGHGVLTMNNDVDRLHIKKIKGYFMLMKSLSKNSANDNNATVRFVSVRNVKLLHLHTTPPAPPVDKPEEKDTLTVDSLATDSVPKPTPPEAKTKPKEADKQ